MKSVRPPVKLFHKTFFFTNDDFSYLAIMIVVSVSGLSVACCSIKACKGREVFKSHSDRKITVKWGIAYMVNFFKRSICGASTHL